MICFSYKNIKVQEYLFQRVRVFQVFIFYRYHFKRIEFEKSIMKQSSVGFQNDLHTSSYDYVVLIILQFF